MKEVKVVFQRGAMFTGVRNAMPFPEDGLEPMDITQSEMWPGVKRALDKAVADSFLNALTQGHAPDFQDSVMTAETLQKMMAKLDLDKPFRGNVPEDRYVNRLFATSPLSGSIINFDTE